MMIKNALIGTPKDLIYEKWTMGELPVIEGWQQDIDFIGHAVKIRVSGEEFTVKVGANIFIEKQMYFHYMPLSEISGFKDEIDGGIITKSITTSPLSLDILRSAWQPIESKEQLKVKPILTFGLLA